MAPFRSQPYPVDLYQPGAVDATRFQVTFTDRKGELALVAGGEVSYTTGARSCTCVDFTLGDKVCLHIRARERAFRRFAREYRLQLPSPPRPLWAEDIGE